MTPHTISREDLLQELSVSPERGLSAQEAQERLAKYGENKLTGEEEKDQSSAVFGPVQGRHDHHPAGGRRQSPLAWPAPTGEPSWSSSSRC